MSPSSTAVVMPGAIRGRGLHRTPGELVVDRGRVEFRTASAPVFRVPLAEVDAVAWPWWWFGSRLVITVRGERYRISFGPEEETTPDTDRGSTADSDGDVLIDIGIALIEVVVRLVGRSSERAAVRQLREILRPAAH